MGFKEGSGFVQIATIGVIYAFAIIRSLKEYLNNV